MLNRLNSFLKEKNIIIKEQSGFRQHRNTKDNLIFLIQKAQEALASSEKACLILFDLQSAFDSMAQWFTMETFKIGGAKVFSQMATMFFEG